MADTDQALDISGLRFYYKWSYRDFCERNVPAIRLITNSSIHFSDWFGLG